MNQYEAEWDDPIREALTREELELFDRLGKPSLPDLITDTFRGRFAVLNVLGIVGTIVFLVLGVICAIGLFQAQELRTMILWLAGLGYCLLVVLGGKLWYWMELNRVTMTRELKRVELQIAHLSAELREQRGDETAGVSEQRL